MGKNIDALRYKTYKEVCALLKKYGKCAIIRPTGFGKTGILTKVIRENGYKNIVYLYPADVVKDAVLDFYYGVNCDKGLSIPGVKFVTYMWLATAKDEKIKKLKDTDLIICDECHKLGATETIDGLTKLLNVAKKAHILGATATPERMDMVDEIAMFFDDHVTSRYTLHDAFKDGILKRPYYCFCAYGETDPKVLEKIHKDAALETIYLTGKERKAATDLLAARAIEIANISKMDYAFKTTLEEAKINPEYQKYIVFFRNFELLHKHKKKVKRWLRRAYPDHEIRELIVTSETEEYRQNTGRLDNFSYKENCIDLIYTCDMINMGYHVSNLTGIIMYRGTYSGTIYNQQLGRVLSTGDLEPKVVFDVVDNLHRKSIYSMLADRRNVSEERIDENGNYVITKEELKEYDELVKKTNDKTPTGEPVKLTADETARLIELARMIKTANDYKLGKRGNNTLYQDDLVVTAYEGTYRELIAKTVAEPISMRCRQAWNRWLEKGGDASIMKRDFILGQVPPEAVPLSPFCKLKNVSVNAVLNEMGVSA